MQDDQTYETQSRISFVASRFENGERITCEANNPVLEAHNEEPERASVTLQVKCEYAILICYLISKIRLGGTRESRNCFRKQMQCGEFQFERGLDRGKEKNGGGENLPPLPLLDQTEEEMSKNASLSLFTGLGRTEVAG